MANVSEQEAGTQDDAEIRGYRNAPVVLIVGMMIIPLPTALLDILLSMNITFGVVILLHHVLRQEGAGDRRLSILELMIWILKTFIINGCCCC